MYRILMIEDDVDICQLLAEYLTPEGFVIDTAHNGVDGLEKAKDNSYQLILLDIMLPGLDGLSVLKKLRQTNETPVLMLTARGDDIDRIVGLELGADDYLAKPFNPRELLARMRAILRRADIQQHQSDTDIPEIEYNGVYLNTLNRKVTCHGNAVQLTATEFLLLEYLMRHKGHVISKETLSLEVLGKKLQMYDRSLDVHVSNIRKKLMAGEHSEKIQTLRGTGYMFITGNE